MAHPAGRIRDHLQKSSLTRGPVDRAPVPGAPRHPGAPVVPRIVADTATTAARRARTIARPSDARSRLHVARLTAESALGLHHAQADPQSAVPVHVAANRTIWLRPRSHDITAFEFLLEEDHHLPPPELTGPVRHIAVLGANIGLLLADLADRYLAARLLGVEPDPGNAAVARRNLARLGDRAVLVEAAAADRDGTLTMSWGHDAWGLQNAGAESAAPGTRTVPARDTKAMLREFAPDAAVDYVLVCIEGAWYDLLRHGEWTRDVRAIKVEIQDHYDEAVPLLESLGFRACIEPLRWGAYVVGVRPNAT
jgi:FkbM family methyltransferase